MWQFQDYSVIQILCEINFEEYRCSDTAIITHLEALNLDLDKFLNAEIYSNPKIQSPEIAKMAFLNFNIF